MINLPDLDKSVGSILYLCAFNNAFLVNSGSLTLLDLPVRLLPPQILDPLKDLAMAALEIFELFSITKWTFTDEVRVIKLFVKRRKERKVFIFL